MHMINPFEHVNHKVKHQIKLNTRYINNNGDLTFHDDT